MAATLVSLFLTLTIGKLPLRAEALKMDLLNPLSNWPLLEVYLEEGRIKIDNNLVNNAIRPTRLESECLPWSRQDLHAKRDIPAGVSKDMEHQDYDRVSQPSA